MEMLLSDNLVESVHPHEIDEMIRLCDKTGDSKVRLEEFLRMAHNKTLNPIG
jgi:Ca2+-binding EF-hand superfamily protein